MKMLAIARFVHTAKRLLPGRGCVARGWQSQSAHPIVTCCSRCCMMDGHKRAATGGGVGGRPSAFCGWRWRSRGRGAPQAHRTWHTLALTLMWACVGPSESRSTVFIASTTERASEQLQSVTQGRTNTVALLLRLAGVVQCHTNTCVDSGLQWTQLFECLGRHAQTGTKPWARTLFLPRQTAPETSMWTPLPASARLDRALLVLNASTEAHGRWANRILVEHAARIVSHELIVCIVSATDGPLDFGLARRAMSDLYMALWDAARQLDAPLLDFKILPQLPARGARCSTLPRCAVTAPN